MAPHDGHEAGVSIEVAMNAPVDTVWHWLRDPDAIRRWHGWQYEGLDEEIEVIYQAAQEGDEPYLLRIDGGDLFRLLDNGPTTTVTISRLPRAEGDEEWADWHDDITQGWMAFLQQLRFALEREPVRERRTLYFSGAGLPTVPPLQGLGVEARQAGQPYAATGHPDLRGEVWHVTALQVGLTIDSLGPGLLVVLEIPASEHAPEGAMQAILTTYGLDDATLATVRDEWSAWWRTSYPDADAATG